MSNYRYTLSLIITTIVYTSLGLFFWFLLSLKMKEEEPKIDTIEIKIVEYAKPKPIAKPKPKPKPIPKPKPEPKSVAKPEPEPKPIPKPEPEPIVKPILQQEVPKEIAKKITSEQVVKKIIKTVNLKENFTELDNTFTNRVRENILNNKEYPRAAIRRNIQGRVKVLFDIETDGNISNIRIETNSKILEKATRKCLNKSFPIKIPSEILDKFPKRNISVNIDFRLQ